MSATPVEKLTEVGTLLVIIYNQVVSTETV